MQKTNFQYEILIHDDCSTDGTTEIIKEYEKKYPDLIKPIYEEINQYQNGKPSGSAVWNFSRARGKYFAMCEGDDYWTDPLKLQKQVDFLESHPEVGMVYSDFNILDQQTGKFYPSLFKNHPDVYPKVYPDVASFVLRKGYVAPPSWMFRQEIKPFNNGISSLDGTFVYFTHFLATTKVYAFDEAMVTYRILEESASHSKDMDKMFKRARNLLDTQMALIDKYGLENELKEQCTELHYKTILASAIANERKDVVEAARKEIIHKSVRDNLLFLIYYINPRIIKLLYIIRGFLKKHNIIESI